VSSKNVSQTRPTPTLIHKGPCTCPLRIIPLALSGAVRVTSPGRACPLTAGPPGRVEALGSLRRPTGPVPPPGRRAGGGRPTLVDVWQSAPGCRQPSWAGPRGGPRPPRERLLAWGQQGLAGSTGRGRGGGGGHGSSGPGGGAWGPWRVAAAACGAGVPWAGVPRRGQAAGRRTNSHRHLQTAPWEKNRWGLLAPPPRSVGQRGEGP
jgi:hypothetical protein